MGQALSGVNSKWSDSYVEWDIFCFAPAEPAKSDTTRQEPEETRCGELKLRWLSLKEDWSEWEYEIGDEKGTIKMKWKEDPSHWELRSYNGSVITMRTAWPKDYTEWRVTDNSVTLLLKTHWSNQLDDWVVKDETHGSFEIKTVYHQDPRDWEIDDRTDASISDSMRMALLFLAVYNGSPQK
jgi:hypothetical protein